MLTNETPVNKIEPVRVPTEEDICCGEHLNEELNKEE